MRPVTRRDISLTTYVITFVVLPIPKSMNLRFNIGVLLSKWNCMMKISVRVGQLFDTISQSNNMLL